MEKPNQIKEESKKMKITALFSKMPQTEVDGENPGSSHQTKQLTGGDLKTSSQSSKPTAANNDVPDSTHPHTHTFMFGFNDGKETEITCRQKGTIQESLERSRDFSKHMAQTKNKTKGIIIKRNLDNRNLGHIVGHFPCSSIRGEKLTIYLTDNFMDEAGSPDTEQDDKDCFTFTVENICHHNSTLKTLLKSAAKQFSPVCVYGYKNETVLSALMRDGRFDKYIFERTSKLMHDETSIELDENCFCENVSTRVFKCKILAEYREGSGNQRQKAQGKCETKGSLQKQKSETQSAPPAQPSGTQTRDKEKSDSTQPTKQSRYEIPDSKEILKLLREQFGKLLEHLRQRQSRKKTDLDLIKEEYLKHSEGFSILTMENMLNLARSVCKVQTSDGNGTGFLLFSDYILTNAHVIESIYNGTDQVLESKASVSFDFKNENGTYDSKDYPVKQEVLAYKIGVDSHGRYVDFAVLQFAQKPMGLKPLIDQYTSAKSEKHSICMIGHPDGGVKKIDISVLIIHEEREEASEGEPYLTWSPETLRPQIQKGANIKTYDTCFGHGSSGSPVIDSGGRLIAMHTGTLHYGNQKYVMEYAIPMKSILDNIFMILTEKGLVEQLVSLLTDASGKEVKSRRKSFVDIIEKGDPRFLPVIQSVDKRIRGLQSQPMETD